jgi:hypothetical protein
MDIRTELAQIPDPRIDRCKKHNLVDILLLRIIAMVCRVENVEDIVFFGETHENWLRKYLALPQWDTQSRYRFAGVRPDRPPEVRGMFSLLDLRVFSGMGKYGFGYRGDKVHNISLRQRYNNGKADPLSLFR